MLNRNRQGRARQIGLIISWMTVLLIVQLGRLSRAMDDPNGKQKSSLLSLTVSIDTYIDDYVTYIKEKPDDWYKRLPREKQELVIKALRGIGKLREIRTAFGTEVPSGKNCHDIKVVGPPVLFDSTSKDGKFSLRVPDKEGNELTIEGKFKVSDGGAAVEHNCATKGTEDTARVRYKLIVTLTGGGLDLKEVTIDNRKEYLAKYDK